jgi:hypothetical protein
VKRKSAASPTDTWKKCKGTECNNGRQLKNGDADAVGALREKLRNMKAAKLV